VSGWPGVVVEIAVAIVAVVVLWLVARFVRGLVQGELSRRRIQPEVVRVVSRVAFVAVLVVGLFVGASVVGQGQLGASGVLAATILAALGIQDILRNYVSGIYLLTERRLNIGDEIEFGAHVGTIIEIRFRVTYVRDQDGSLIVVPNAELFNSVVVIRSNKKAGDADRPSVPTSDPAPKRAAARRAAGRAAASRKPRA
jgi:small conductance mechanosensitive channel